MTINDILLTIKNGSLKECVYLPESDKSIGDLKCIYPVVFTKEDWRKAFPKIDANKIILSKNFSNPVLYIDIEKFILCSLRIMSFSENKTFDILKLNNSASDEDVLLHTIRLYEELYESNEIEKLFFFLPEEFKLDMLDKCIDYIPKNLVYKIFLDMYSDVDYGFGNLTENTMQKIFAAKTDTQIENTNNALGDLPEIVTVYRGEGDRSNASSIKMSYTLDINIANFFAIKNTPNSASIMKAKVRKLDILEIINDRNEHEVLVNPSSLYDVDIIYLKSAHDAEAKEIMIKINEDMQEIRQLISKTCARNVNGDHDATHMYRVTFLALYIAFLRGNEKEIVDPIKYAAALHDIERTNDNEDTVHGFKSVKKARTLYSKIYSNELVQFIMGYHAKDDSDYFEYITKNVPENEKEIYFECIKIMKDADALDRVRFGVKDLDMNYLRTEEAKVMTLIAQQALHGLIL